MPTFAQHRKNITRKIKYILSNFPHDLHKFLYHFLGPISAFVYVVQSLYINYRNKQAQKKGQITEADYASIKIPLAQIGEEFFELFFIRPVHAIWKMISYPLIFGINTGLTITRFFLTFPLFWLSSKKSWLDYLLPHQWTTLFDRIASGLILPALYLEEEELSECFLYKNETFREHLYFHRPKRNFIIKKVGEKDNYAIIFFKDDGSVNQLELQSNQHRGLIDLLNRYEITNGSYLQLENENIKEQLRSIVADNEGRTFSMRYDSSITKIIQESHDLKDSGDGSNQIQCDYKKDHNTFTVTRNIYTYSDGDKVYYFRVKKQQEPQEQPDANKKYLIVHNGNAQIADDESTLEMFVTLAEATGSEVICAERRGVGFEYKSCEDSSFSQNRMGYYRGFDDLIRDGREFYDHLMNEKGAKHENIALIGTSLGGAEAVEITAENHRRDKKNGVVYISSFTTFTDEIAGILHNELRIEKGRDKIWVKVILFPFDILARLMLFAVKNTVIRPLIWIIGLNREPIEAYRSIQDKYKLIMAVEKDRIVPIYASPLHAEESRHRAVRKALGKNLKGNDPSWFTADEGCNPHCARLEELRMRDRSSVTGLMYVRDWINHPTSLQDRMTNYLPISLNGDADLIKKTSRWLILFKCLVLGALITGTIISIGFIPGAGILLVPFTSGIWGLSVPISAVVISIGGSLISSAISFIYYRSYLDNPDRIENNPSLLSSGQPAHHSARQSKSSDISVRSSVGSGLSQPILHDNHLGLPSSSFVGKIFQPRRHHDMRSRSSSETSDDRRRRDSLSSNTIYSGSPRCNSNVSVDDSKFSDPDYNQDRFLSKSAPNN